MRHPLRFAFAVLPLACLALPVAAQRDAPIIGRWDLTVTDGRGSFPSWLEVQVSGYSTLVGSFVGRGGSARPISKITYSDGRFSFSIPPQWERGEDMVLEGTYKDYGLSGRMKTPDGKWLDWTALRAPALKRDKAPSWGESLALFNGKDLAGWKADRAANGWVVRDGVLKNAKPGANLITERKFTDFKLHTEFRYPRGSNSGIYLRGRYEAQVEDNYGQDPESHKIGGIYGFLTPRVNAARKPDEWQTYDVTLIGRRVTIVLNGQEVIEDQEIPGITGGALDSREGEPGPIMLQGDHGPIDFRKISLTPAL
jgi:hypothetical protein